MRVKSALIGVALFALPLSAFHPAEAGSIKTVYKFQGGADGAGPVTPLVNINGTLYGATTTGGGACNCGTLFSLTPNGVKTTLYEFQGQNDGAFPFGLVLTGNAITGASGTSGGNVIFSMTAGGKFTVLGKVAHPLWPNQAHPLTAIGNVWYGVNHGLSNNCAPRYCGYVYSITPPQN